MKKLFAAVVAVAFLAVGPAFAAGPGKVTLTPPAGNKQGPVTFDHAGKTHATLDCKTCHADAKGGKITPALDMKTGHATCQKCHNETAAKDESKKAIKGCTNCHAKK